jgi:leucyl-tRNA synthetase
VPIPVVKCEKCGYVPVKEKDLPVKLPEIKDYKPTGDGESPLAKVEKWKSAKCPQCGGKAERETDTLDTFVDSSWYFLRYTDPKNKKEFALPAKMKNWMPVNFYSGGAEHTTMHLLYSRFWHKALFDCGLVADEEPYVRRMNRGLILGPDNQKMSKSRGNVIDPDKEVERLGSDAVRMYLAFIGPYNEVGSYPWNPDGAVGVRRFLERVWRLGQKTHPQPFPKGREKNNTSPFGGGKEGVLLNHTIKKVGEAIESFKMNTGVSALMILLNEFEKHEQVSVEDYKIFLRLLAPFAPFITEELWAALGNKKSIHQEQWPAYDPKVAESELITIIVQVNGKVRGSFSANRNISESDAFAKAESLDSVSKHISGKEVKKRIFVKDKLVSFVAK